MHNFDPNDAIIELSPREGEYALREEDILAAIEKDGQSVAVVLFSGIQYFSGQFFPIENITRAAQAQVSNIKAVGVYTHAQAVHFCRAVLLVGILHTRLATFP